MMEAEITAMVMSFDQAIAAAIRHLDSAVSMRDEKLEDITYLDNGESPERRTEKRLTINWPSLPASLWSLLSIRR